LSELDLRLLQNVFGGVHEILPVGCRGEVPASSQYREVRLMNVKS